MYLDFRWKWCIIFECFPWTWNSILIKWQLRNKSGNIFYFTYLLVFKIHLFNRTKKNISLLFHYWGFYLFYLVLLFVFLFHKYDFSLFILISLSLSFSLYCRVLLYPLFSLVASCCYYQKTKTKTICLY